MKIILSILCFFISFSALAQQADQEKISRALSGIMTGSGKITKEQYNIFWSEVGVEGNKQEKRKVIASIQSDFLAIQSYQREIWKCAEKNWVSKKNIPCASADSKISKIRANLKKLNQEAALKPVEDSSYNILSAAAKRSSTFKAGTADLPFSLEFIKRTREKMDGVFSRIDQLFKEEYSGN